LLAQLQQAIRQSPDVIDLTVDEIRGLHIRINPGTRTASVDQPAAMPALRSGKPAQPQPFDSAQGRPADQDSPVPAPKRRLMPLATANATPLSPGLADTVPALSVVEGGAKRDEKTQIIDPANLTRTLKQLLADLLYFEDVAVIDESAKFIELGMDSVTGVEFINMINRRFALKLKAVVLYDYPSIHELATFLFPLLQYESLETPVHSNAPPAKAKPMPPATGDNGGEQTPLRELLTKVAKGELTPQASRMQLEEILGDHSAPAAPSAEIANQEQVLEVMREYIVEISPTVAGQMKPTHTFDELGLDSVDQAEIIVKTMEKLGINAPRAEFAKAKTIGGVAELFAKQLQPSEE
jgi:acyl carrier protein